MHDFHFIRPYYLLALVPYAVVLYHYWQHKLSQANWSQVCDAELLPYLLQNAPQTRQRLGLISLCIGGLLGIIALAGPTWQRLAVPAFRNSSALVIALDLSTSMNAQDIKPSRLSRARYKIADILKQRKDGQTALVVFAGAAFTVTPLTDDIATIDSQLSALTTSIMPAQGDNAQLAIDKAVALLKQAGLPRGHILLVTDGVENQLDTAPLLTGNYHLSVLAVASKDGAPIVESEGGFLKDADGAIVIPKLDETALLALAQAGQGRYQAVSDTDSDIQTLLADLNAPTLRGAGEDPKSDLALQQWQDIGVWLIPAILPLAALSFRKGLLTIALLLLLPLPKNSYAFGWQDLWQTPDQQAMQAFTQGDYAKASQQFANKAWQAAAHYKAGAYDKALEALKTVPDAYNQGNALAKKGLLKEALAAYKQALARNPQDSDAQFNKELVEKALQEQQKPQQNQDKNGQGNQPDNLETQQNKPASDEKQSAENGSEGQNENKAPPPPSQQANKAASEEQQGQQAQADNKNAGADKKAQALQAAEQTSEQQQANEQWLKRIPDDPAGLLRRKFKYQYGQTSQSAAQDAGL